MQKFGVLSVAADVKARFKFTCFKRSQQWNIENKMFFLAVLLFCCIFLLSSLGYKDDHSLYPLHGAGASSIFAVHFVFSREGSQRVHRVILLEPFMDPFEPHKGRRYA